MRNRTPFGGWLVGNPGPVAAAFLADDEQQPDPCLALVTQLFGSGDLSCQNAFRVAGSTSKDKAALFPAGKERRDAVEMGGEDDGGIGAEPREDVEPPRGDRLLDNVVPALP